MNAKVYEPPVPIKIIAANCGARVLPYELGDEVSGILVYEDNKGFASALFDDILTYNNKFVTQ